MKKNIIQGVIWNVLSLIVSKGFGFFVQIILARLLVPEDFGIVGMAIVFTNLVMVVGDLGLASSLIQMKESDLKPIHLNTVFWSSILINIVLYTIVVLAVAPFTVWFYSQTILFSVISVLSIQIVIKSFIVIPKVLLNRHLDFKKINIIEIISTLIAGTCALFMARIGYEVWSIVFMGLINAMISLPLFWVYCKWRPNLSFSKQALKDVFSKGAFDTLQRISMSLTSNIDYLFIGKLVSSLALGYYTLAFVITDTFRQQIMSVLNKVLFPIFGKLQDDKLEIKKYYLKVVKLNSYIITPLMVVLIGFTEPIVIFLVGEEWLTSLFPIKAMAFASIVHSIGGGTDAVLKGLGKFQLNFKIYTIKTLVITIPVFYFSIYFYGINGAAIAVIIHKAIARVIYQVFMKKIISVSEFDLLKAVSPALFGSMAATPVVVYFNYIDTNNILIVLLFMLSTLLIYFLVSLKFILQDLKNIFNVKAIK